MSLDDDPRGKLTAPRSLDTSLTSPGWEPSARIRGLSHPATTPMVDDRGTAGCGTRRGEPPLGEACSDG